MEVQTFIADSAPAAVAQIREQLGPEAVVLNVRKLPPEGLSRLWQKARIEVLACRPEPAPPAPAPADALAELRQELAEIRQQVSARDTRPATFPSRGEPGFDPAGTTRPRGESAGGWRIGAVLENSGLLPLRVQRVVEELIAGHGPMPPESLAEEVELACGVLTRQWRPADPPAVPGVHVFVGAPGSGKTTCLCKWLAQAVLIESRPAQVWRLDGRAANTAESLSVYAEILGVPVERFQPADGIAPGTARFVDLPGVNWSDPAEVRELARRIGGLPAAQVHLVLNAAYETPVLLAQLRAFAALPVADLIFTHLDEEPRWGKLWNFVGMNFSVRFLSAGQNVPGEFQAASPEKIFARQFARK